MKFILYVYVVTLLSLRVAECCKKNSCGGDKKKTQCGTTCEQTCHNYYERACTTGCVADVCRCPVGTILENEGSDECVVPEKCPCPGNQVRQEKCKSPCELEEACVNDPTKLCVESCALNACGCPEGMVFLEEEGQECVRKEKCPAVSHPPCPSNQVRIQECLTPCELEKSCVKRDPDIPCYEICSVNACGCPKGMVFLEKGGEHCVREEECPAVSDPPCPSNQVRIQECLTPCELEKSCAKIDPHMPCVEICTVNACGCPKGMVFLEKGGEHCVREEECPAVSDPPCPSNQVRIPNCKSPCDLEKSCVKRDPSELCIEIGVCNACGCPEDMVFLDKGGDYCVLESECPAA